MNQSVITRRTVLYSLGAGATAAAIGATAKSYAQILGANDRLNIAVLGVNGRGQAHLAAVQGNASARVSHICDVDSTVLAKRTAEATTELGYAPQAVNDYRTVLESKDVDAITIALPDHWHTPMAILGLKAGKHVYVEKPSSHNPREGELLVQAQQKYGKLVQVGDQQRSWEPTIKIIQQIHEGLIGQTYLAKCWYVSRRNSMGTGKVAPVPSTLNWELWQGPAPRSEYKDNIHPYNWHWLRRYGTGEALNNGTHELDICRWALQVEYPESVTATGGRYQAKDDWEFYDTLITSFQYPSSTISWEGRSCQGMRIYNRDRGSVIHGTKGTVIIDRRGYEVYDWKGKKTDEFATGRESSSSDLISKDSMTDGHFANWINAIHSKEKLNSPVQIANISVTTLLLSNISWSVNRELRLDSKSAHILGDAEAMRLWGREYEKGWEVRI